MVVKFKTLFLRLSLKHIDSHPLPQDIKERQGEGEHIIDKLSEHNDEGECFTTMTSANNHRETTTKDSITQNVIAKKPPSVATQKHEKENFKTAPSSGSPVHDVTTSTDGDSTDSSDNSTSTMSEEEDIEDAAMSTDTANFFTRPMLEAKGSLHAAQSYNRPVDNSDQSKSLTVVNGNRKYHFMAR